MHFIDDPRPSNEDKGADFESRWSRDLVNADVSLWNAGVKRQPISQRPPVSAETSRS